MVPFDPYVVFLVGQWNPADCGGYVPRYMGRINAELSGGLGHTSWDVVDSI